MNIASMIDHTILKADAKKSDIVKVCDEAKKYGFKSVCVNSGFTKFAAKQLEGSNVDVCTVVGFPLGAMDTKCKAYETRRAIELGANEIDMVINIGAVKDKDFEYVLSDIKAVVDAAKDKALTKVILETCLLTKEEIVKVCKLSKKAGADFVKTSTGFSTGGAKIEDLELMRKTVGNGMGVKASGGVRTKEDAKAVIAAGATRIGASSSVAIVEGISDNKGGY